MDSRKKQSTYNKTKEGNLIVHILCRNNLLKHFVTERR